MKERSGVGEAAAIGQLLSAASKVEEGATGHVKVAGMRTTSSQCQQAATNRHSTVVAKRLVQTCLASCSLDHAAGAQNQATAAAD